ncbi:MAG TPA: hypothetical protein VI670_20275 [Thermoanaerobaculia bacterium]|jgi:hypothetical protein
MRLQALPLMGVHNAQKTCTSGLSGPLTVSFTVSGTNLKQKITGTIAPSTTYVSVPINVSGPFTVAMGLSDMSDGQVRTVLAANAVVTYIPIYFPITPQRSGPLMPTMIVRVPTT